VLYQLYRVTYMYYVIYTKPLIYISHFLLQLHVYMIFGWKPCLSQPYHRMQTVAFILIGMKKKIDPFSHFSLLTKVWMPSTIAKCYTINLLELWFRLFQRSICSHHFMFPQFSQNLVLHFVLQFRYWLPQSQTSLLFLSQCYNSSINYCPAGHIITGDLNIKYRESPC